MHPAPYKTYAVVLLGMFCDCNKLHFSDVLLLGHCSRLFPMFGLSVHTYTYTTLIPREAWPDRVTPPCRCYPTTIFAHYHHHLSISIWCQKSLGSITMLLMNMSFTCGRVRGMFWQRERITLALAAVTSVDWGYIWNCALAYYETKSTTSKV